MPSLILIPWHIGNEGDVTLNALRRLRGLRLVLAEDPAAARKELARLLRGRAGAKRVLRLPPAEDRELLDEVWRALEVEDVGVVASGGAPCFVDPGAWLVRALRERGAAVAALGGASCLPAVFSLSGVEWTGRPGIASVLFFAAQYSRSPRGFEEAFRRQDPEQACVVLLRAPDFAACLAALQRAAPERPVSAFFDATKDRRRYPYADRVETLACRAWLERARELDWDRVGDVALLVHPA